MFVWLCACVLVGSVTAELWPLGKSASCSFSYEDAFGFGRINPTHNWRCSESQFNTPYPKPKIDELLMLDQYYDFKEALAITQGCHDFNVVNAMAMNGDNSYYQWEGMCKMVRTPVQMVWAKPDNVVVPAGLMGINNGYLPCHVLEGQHLYDVDCMHPWYGGNANLPRSLARRLKRVKWTPSKQRLCHYGYMYNSKYVCKPTGYMSRHVLVYSPDMHIIFKAKIDDIPTSCMCATCDCEHVNPLINLPPVVRK